MINAVCHLLAWVFRKPHAKVSINEFHAQVRSRQSQLLRCEFRCVHYSMLAKVDYIDRGEGNLIADELLVLLKGVARA